MNFQDLVENDSIDPSLYTSAEIFEEEIRRIFENGWVWVAHESEIAEPKSFKATVIGRQAVIVTRDIDGKVYVMLNRCRHRAAAVCEVEQGQTPRFRCPYHGWLYNLSGKLIGVPSAEGYGEDFDRADFSLQQVRAEQYGGFWFATMNNEAESLLDFLGEAKPWIDLFNKQSAGWPLAVLGAHKFTYEGNWKIALENSSDGYHLPVVHNSYLKYVDSETADRLAAVTNSETLYVRTLGNGHCIGLFDDDAVDLDLPSRYPKPKHYKALEAELLKEYPQEVTDRIVRAVGGVGFNLCLFPNISLSGAFLRELRPISASRTEVRHMALGMKDGPSAGNEVRLRVHEQFQGPAGLGTSDDREIWERVGRGVKSGPEMRVLLNRGLNRERDDGGQKISNTTDETGMRGIYSHWKRVMSDAE